MFRNSLDQVRSGPVSKKRHLMMDSLFSSTNHVVKPLTSVFWFLLEDQKAARMILLPPSLILIKAGRNKPRICDSLPKSLSTGIKVWFPSGYVAAEPQRF